MTEKLLSTNEAAKILGVKKATLDHWRCVRRYALRYVRVGRNIRYRPEDLEKFVESRTVSGDGKGESKGRAKRQRRLRS